MRTYVRTHEHTYTHTDRISLYTLDTATSLFWHLVKVVNNVKCGAKRSQSALSFSILFLIKVKR